MTLIGMPASGKSTLGEKLAEKLGFTFVDVDRIIEAEEKRLLKEIIADEGDDGFWPSRTGSTRGSRWRTA